MLTEVAGAGDQIVLGQVSWSQPARPQRGDSFRIVLLDTRSLRAAGWPTRGGGDGPMAPKVTQRTVELHLTKAYRELDVNGRSQLSGIS
jgi:hypothetical protein